MATPEQIQAVQDAYFAINREELNEIVAASIADAINNNQTTLDAFIAGQIQTNITTTAAAVAIASFVTGVTPTAEKLDALKIEADKQVASYTAMGVGNPALGAYEAFGKGFAETPEFAAKYGILSADEFVNAVYSEVFGQLPNAGAKANLLGQIAYFENLYKTAVPPLANATELAKGAVLGQIVGYAFVSDASANSILDDQVANFLTAIANGDGSAYGAPLAPIANPSQTFILTAGADVGAAFTGGNGNDVFVATQATLGSADDLNGGGGIDTLRYASSGAIAANSAGFKTASIENIEITSDATLGTTFDVSGIVGAQKLVNSNSSSDLTLTGLNNLVDIEIRNTSLAQGGSVNTTVVYTAAAVAGATDVQNIKLANVIDPVAGVNGAPQSAINLVGDVETVALTVESNSRLTNLDSTNLKTVTATGEGDLLVASVGFDVAANVFNATGLTGKLDITLNTSGANDVAVTGGSNDDRADFTAGFDAGDSYDGAGGIDTLALSNATATQAVLGGTVTAVEILEVTDAAVGTIDADNFAGIGTYDLAGGLDGLGGNVLVDDAVSGIIVKVNGGADGGSTLEVDLKTDAAADVATVQFYGLNTGDGLGTLTVDDAETLNLQFGNPATAGTGEFLLGVLNAADATSIVVTGDADLVWTGGSAATDPSVLDLNAFTGDTEISGLNLAAAGAVVTLGSGDDTFVVAQANGSDTFDLTKGGADTVVYSAVVQSDDDVDTINGFNTADDVVNVRDVYGVNSVSSDSQFLGARSSFALAQGALSGAGIGNVEVVYQQDENILWVDNGDGVLNDLDFRVILTGVDGANLTAENIGILPGVTFTANKAAFDTSVAADSVEGVVTADNDDTINAAASQLAGSTIDGEGGDDTLNISGTGAADLSAAALSNVETVNVTAAAVTSLTIAASDFAANGGAVVTVTGTGVQQFTVGNGADLTQTDVSGVSSLNLLGTATIDEANLAAFPVITGDGATSQLILNGNVNGIFDFSSTILAGVPQLTLASAQLVTLDIADLAGLTTIDGGAQSDIKVNGSANLTGIAISAAAVADLEVTGANLTLNDVQASVFDDYTGNGNTSITVVNTAGANASFGTLTGFASLDANQLVDDETVSFTAVDALSVSVSTADVAAGSSTGDLTVFSSAAFVLADQSVTTGSGNDQVTVSPAFGGTNHTVSTGDGDDIINFGNGLTATDVVDGGADDDTLNFTDSNGATTDLDGVTNVETIVFGNAATAVTTVNGLIAAGETVTFDGTALGAGNALTLNLAAETDGQANVTVGAGGSTITFTSNNLVDTYTLGAGNDDLILDANNTVANLANADVVNGFNVAGNDSFDTGNAGVGTFTITLGADTTLANFVGNVNSALQSIVGYAGAAAQYDVIVVDVAGGDLAGTYALQDTTAADGIDATAFAVKVVGAGIISAADFV